MSNIFTEGICKRVQQDLKNIFAESNREPTSFRDPMLNPELYPEFYNRDKKKTVPVKYVERGNDGTV